MVTRLRYAFAITRGPNAGLACGLNVRAEPKLGDDG